MLPTTIQNTKISNAVSYHADYLYWFKIEKPIKDLILIREYPDEDPELKKEQQFFRKVTKIGEITNSYSREKGAAVFLLEGATIDINTIILSEIEEEKQ